jgi:hypothetical protein
MRAERSEEIQGDIETILVARSGGARREVLEPLEHMPAI